MEYQAFSPILRQEELDPKLSFSELDALPCANHLEAVDGIAHACGHNAQCAAMLGLAGALKEQGVLDELCGSIRLIVVPAEEMIQTEYREKLCQEKITSCYSGKPEYMKRGFLDGADMAFMIHTASDAAHMFSCNTGHNGFILKTGIFSNASKKNILIFNKIVDLTPVKGYNK